VTRSTEAELHVEMCNQCHPFYTGKQRLVDSGGRVERFRKRYGQIGSASTAGATAPDAADEPADSEDDTSDAAEA
jgi:hypothetical protein